MCGISGAVTTRRGLDIRGLVTRIVEHQFQRGPDARVVGSYQTPEFDLVLGHNRLSIIDLRPEANQPMAAATNDLLVVLNGEIYNYVEIRAELETLGAVFRTRSDTEVLLAAYRQWDEQAFERFIGMFAFALYDARTREVVLVRDRFGVKPLYYWTDGATLVFASTPTVIAQWAGLKPDLNYVARGIRYKYYEDETAISPYVGVHALEPSHLVRVRCVEGRLALTKRRYYDVQGRALDLTDEIVKSTDRELEARLLELLRDACRLRQRSDVPLGLSVSGGVDSGGIAAIVSQGGSAVLGYSYSHPDQPDSEGPFVAQLARHVGLTPRYVWLDGRREIIDLFWQTLAAQDAPFPNASIMAQYAVFRAARADGTVVLLGGQGGDEAFMGYRKYLLFYAQAILRGRRLAELPHVLSAVLPAVPALVRRADVFLAERKRYSGAEGGMSSCLELPPDTHGCLGMGRGQSMMERQALDITRLSLPTLLRYEDRNSMGNSVESRLPFMDQRLVEFGLALPDRLKLGNGLGKLILRRALKGLIPERIRRNRDKRGFDVNYRRWISAGLGAELRLALDQRKSVVAHMLPRGGTTHTLFSDVRLQENPQVFKEAVSLIWLGDRL